LIKHPRIEFSKLVFVDCEFSRRCGSSKDNETRTGTGRRWYERSCDGKTDARCAGGYVQTAELENVSMLIHGHKPEKNMGGKTEGMVS